MPRWVCPRCDREFGAEHQAHTCVPGCTVDDTFANSPPGQRRAYDTIMAYLQTLGPVHEDGVQVGVFLKRQRKFAEIRPMSRALSLNLVLPRTVRDSRVLRTARISSDRVVHVIRLSDATEVDEQVREWLTEAFLAAGADSG
ncbi:MAG: DUF5655 domain-containing protein [Frankiaceae bacterium]